ncbi:hypothetical protein XELAEV_18031073mg [Xenopus laevis]|uniref:Helix-turn-helix domain-containing protein n=1 Tax=Xenopus laevis TaxID=8355 RepID=A0A974HFE2_XENLA|nr:hypothetical protein XELAEV_18031073mg [Xenopus laevis]
MGSRDLLETQNAESSQLWEGHLLKRGGVLTTDLFRKSSDRNTLLHYNSFNPIQTRKSLPKSQFVRVKRIVTDGNLLKERLDEMEENFLQRGYPPGLLKQQCEEIEDPCVSPHHKRDQKHIPFVSKFSTVSQEVAKIIRKHWDILRDGVPEVEFFQNMPLMSYKRNNKIRSTLVKSDLGGTPREERFLRPRNNGTLPVCSVIAAPTFVEVMQYTQAS